MNVKINYDGKLHRYVLLSEYTHCGCAVLRFFLWRPLLRTLPWCYNPNFACVVTFLKLLDRTQLRHTPSRTLLNYRSSLLHICKSFDTFNCTAYKGKVKAIPVQAHMVAGWLDSQISRQSAHESAEFVSPKHRSPYPPVNILALNSS